MVLEWNHEMKALLCQKSSHTKEWGSIYKCKINKTIPQLHLFKRYLKTNFEVYKYNAKLNVIY